MTKIHFDDPKLNDWLAVLGLEAGFNDQGRLVLMDDGSGKLEELLLGSSALQSQPLPFAILELRRDLLKSVPKCPVCKGEGRVYNPNHATCDGPWGPCDVCKGSGRLTTSVEG